MPTSRPVVEAVEQAGGQALLDQVNPVGVRPCPGAGFLEAVKHPVGVDERERGEAYYLVGCRGKGEDAALVRLAAPG